MTVDRIEVFKDGGGSWRWRRVAPNNEIISSGESHTRREDAVRAARRANEDQDIEFQVETDS